MTLAFNYLVFVLQQDCHTACMLILQQVLFFQVYTLLACCAPSAIPVQWITNVVMWSEKDAFIEKQMYGSSHSRVKINSDIRNDLSWFQALFGGSNTPSSKLINYEVVQIAKGYHDIFKELFINGNGKYFPYKCG